MPISPEAISQRPGDANESTCHHKNPDFHVFSILECVEESFSRSSIYAAQKGIELAYFIDDELPSFIVSNSKK
jgi:hypothetical protein